jgi:hypothetical protein
MRNLAGDVVENVGLRNTVGGMCSNPTHDAAKIAEEVTVQGCKGSTREGEFRSAVVREEGISVLEESDQDEPVVDPEVGDEVEPEDVGETVMIDGSPNNTEPDGNANDRDDNLAVMVGCEHRRAGNEV